MVKAQTGGDAFPTQITDSGNWGGSGMSLLDYFAGQALIGVVLASLFRDDGVEPDPALMAEGCYDAAVAMTGESERRQTPDFDRSE